MSRTIRDLADAAVDALAGLAALGEDVDDEWSYVTDLEAAWRARLGAVAAARGDEPAGAPVALAVDLVIEEIARIADPHRAIDWLSTFPQVVLVAMGEVP